MWACNYTCVDEQTGAYINVANFSHLDVYAPEIGWHIDLKAKGNGNFTFLANGSYPGTLHPMALRFEVKYAGVNFTITRYFDPTILSNLSSPIRISIPKANTFYMQTVTSTIERQFAVWCLGSSAWVVCDYTRMVGGTTTSYLQYVYTIDALYYFKIYNNGVPIVLTTLDGGKSVTIDLDLLIRSNASLPAIPGGVGIQKLTNHSLLIYFLNTGIPVNSTSVKLTNASGHVFLWYNETSSPNEFMIYYDWTTVTPQPDLNETLTLTVTPYGQPPITKTFILNQITGPITTAAALPAELAMIFIIGLLIFGLTLFSSQTTFSFFGPVMCGIGLVISVLTDQIWFIHLLQFMLIFFIAFMIVVFRYEYSTQEFGG
jgi:hypothetical protein